MCFVTIWQLPSGGEPSRSKRSSINKNSLKNKADIIAKSTLVHYQPISELTWWTGRGWSFRKRITSDIPSDLLL